MFLLLDLLCPFAGFRLATAERRPPCLRDSIDGLRSAPSCQKLQDISPAQNPLFLRIFRSQRYSQNWICYSGNSALGTKPEEGCKAVFKVS